MKLEEMIPTNPLDDPFNFVVVNLQGQLVTTSTQIADYFDKRHDNVIRDIENVLKSCSPKFAEDNYFKSSYVNQQGKTQPMYEMTKDGFTMLAMGYTGPKAMQFKEAYIAAFNKMAEQLNKHNETALQRVEWVTQRTVEKEMEKTRKLLLEEVKKGIKSIR